MAKPPGVVPAESPSVDVAWLGLMTLEQRRHLVAHVGVVAQPLGIFVPQIEGAMHVGHHGRLAIGD